ncbi:hypothetical protein AciPR4_3104 [Terriglobus saanensis SP1PR4]|uniref:Uncharacterized protein n=2 Tax=Terriglobus saanensis TaxID=870903 RepID=E8V6R0_TERSS|nr:hypothetical protein AciPR4_3104 [Terriglobus saanensis SP1PR4]
MASILLLQAGSLHSQTLVLHRYVAEEHPALCRPPAFESLQSDDAAMAALEKAITPIGSGHIELAGQLSLSAAVQTSVVSNLKIDLNKDRTRLLAGGKPLRDNLTHRFIFPQDLLPQDLVSSGKVKVSRKSDTLFLIQREPVAPATSAAAEVELDPQSGLVKIIRICGHPPSSPDSFTLTTLEYSNYMNVSGVALPSKITLQHGNVAPITLALQPLQ